MAYIRSKGSKDLMTFLFLNIRFLTSDTLLPAIHLRDYRNTLDIQTLLGANHAAGCFEGILYVGADFPLSDSQHPPPASACFMVP